MVSEDLESDSTESMVKANNFNYRQGRQILRQWVNSGMLLFLHQLHSSFVDKIGISPQRRVALKFSDHHVIQRLDFYLVNTSGLWFLIENATDLANVRILSSKCIPSWITFECWIDLDQCFCHCYICKGICVMIYTLKCLVKRFSNPGTYKKLVILTRLWN